MDNHIVSVPLSSKRCESIIERFQNTQGHNKPLQQYILKHAFTLFSLHFPLSITVLFF